MVGEQQANTRSGEKLNGHERHDGTVASNDDESLDALREILLDDYQERVRDLHTQIRHLQALLAQVEGQVEQLNDPAALATKITPSLVPAINTAIRESRDSMVDALYPIMGKLVARAVAEALRELVRRIDEQMRSTLSVKSFTRRIQARVAGVSDAELALRDALPFQVLEIFLIYRESGLLIKALSIDPAETEDSDLISGMLTAIRDFAADAFGRDQEGELDEVQYGDRRILLETAQYTYAAIVIRGLESSGFRGEIRERLAEIELKYLDNLLHYDGNAAQFTEAEPQLATLLQGNAKQEIQAHDHPQPPASPAAQSPARPAASRLAPAVRFLLWGIVALLGLLLWRIWYTGQNDEPTPDIIVLILQMMRGMVIDYI